MVIPTTPPVLNAICTARCADFFLAASATRTFALTASHIPLYPTNAENPAPTKKNIDLPIRISRSPGRVNKSTNTIATNTESVLNCLDRYAAAPS